MSRTAFKTYGCGSGWSWRLEGPAEVLAIDSHHYDASRIARNAIDIIRATVTGLSGNEESFLDTDVDAPDIIVGQEVTLLGELPEERNNWV